MANMDRHMKSMQAMHEKMVAARTPEQRQALMDEHMKLMREGMSMMQDMRRRMMMGMGGKGGMGGMGGMDGMGGMGGAGGGKGMGMGMEDRQQMMEKRMDMMESMMQMMMDRMPSAPTR